MHNPQRTLLNLGLRIRRDVKRCVFAALRLIRLVVSIGIFLHSAESEMEKRQEKAAQDKEHADREHFPSTITVLLKGRRYHLRGIVLNPDVLANCATM
jgi:hypothetical protein